MAKHPQQTNASKARSAERPNPPRAQRTWFRTCFQPVLLCGGIHRGLLLSLSFATQGRHMPGSEISLTKNLFNCALFAGVSPCKNTGLLFRLKNQSSHSVNIQYFVAYFKQLF